MPQCRRLVLDSQADLQTVVSDLLAVAQYNRGTHEWIRQAFALRYLYPQVERA